MRSDVDTIKERLNIAEIASGYVKLEKAGASFKACCPFHNEKTPSFFVSPQRQSYYCFGCGAKGDIFTLVEELDGLDFRGALKFLAEKAGVEITHERGGSKTDKDKIINVLEDATMFFEKELAKNKSACSYLSSRGLSGETVKNWRIGYAPGPPDNGWRSLCGYLESLGYDKEVMLKAGLVKVSGTNTNKAPYDTFRDRIIFPLADPNGRIVAFSGRALAKETEPKYLNSPDTILFTKSELLYGLDKAKDEIRKKNYAVLVEGQMDLVLSHQAGVSNTVASSGTAFGRAHLERLKRFSSRIILAFDGDLAGEKARERASELAMSLDLEVKIADLSEGLDPAEVIQNDPKAWKDILRQSLPAIEFFSNKIVEKERDHRRLGKQIEQKILPMIKLIRSAIEQSHFIAMIAKMTGIKEEVLWQDLKKVNNTKPEVGRLRETTLEEVEEKKFVEDHKTPREKIEERLAEIKLWQKELPESAPEFKMFKKEEFELANNLSGVVLKETLNQLSAQLARAEISKDDKLVESLAHQIQEVHQQMMSLEENKKVL